MVKWVNELSALYKEVEPKYFSLGHNRISVIANSYLHNI